VTDPKKQLLEALAALPKKPGMDPELFRAAETLGWHLTPVHFAFPIPDTRTLTDAMFQTPSTLPGIDLNEAGQLAWLETIAQFREEYDAYPDESDDWTQFRYEQNTFRSGDAEALYGAVRHIKPQRVIEIGSGMSTRLFSDAIGKNRDEGVDCHYTVIDPFPKETVANHELEHVSELRTVGVETVPVSFFDSLKSGDILFIDSSHMGRLGSDVNVEFLEILPRLNPGVFVHVHDIFLPYEYPRYWVDHFCWFYNEQYYLQLFLQHNADWEVLYAGSWLHHRHSDRLAAAFGHYNKPEVLPGSFWMRRKS
jgi:hypothetical protein